MNDTQYAKYSIYNTISSIVMQFTITLIGFVLPRLYIVTYGSEVNGLVSSITQFLSYFTIIEAGLSSAGINALYEPLVNKDANKINTVLSTIKRFYYQIGYIFSGLVFGFAFLYPLIVAVEGFSYFKLVILVAVLGLNSVIDFFTLAKYRALLTADQKYYVVANATTISYIVNFIVVYLALKLHLDIVIVRLIALTLFILRSIIINIYVHIHYKYVDLKQKSNNSLLSKRWDAMFLQLLGLAQTSMPVVLLTLFSKDLSTISVYSVYNLVASGILSLLLTFTNGTSALLGNIIASKNKEKIKDVYGLYEFIFTNVVSVIYSCMYILYIPFIKLYTAGIDDCLYVYPVTALLFSLNGIFYNLKTPAGTLIGAAGVFKETKKGTFIQTIIAISMCLVLTPCLGINGLLIGLIVSNIYRDFDLVIYMDKYVVNKPVKESFKSMFLCIFSYCIVSIIFYFIKIEVSNYIQWGVYAIAIFLSAVFIDIVVNFIFNRKEIFRIYEYLRNMKKESI